MDGVISQLSNKEIYKDCHNDNNATLETSYFMCFKSLKKN